MKKQLLLFGLMFFTLIQMNGQPPCGSGNNIITSKPISAAQFDAYYSAIKSPSFKSSVPIKSLSEFKTNYTSNNGTVNLIGFNTEGSAVGYGEIPGLQSFVLSSSNGYSYPRTYSYRVWGTRLTASSIISKDGIVNFKIGTGMIVGNTKSLEINFGDGYGYKPFTTLDNTILSIKYLSYGIKTISLRWKVSKGYCMGSQIYDEFVMPVTLDVKPTPANSINTATATKIKGTAGTNSANYSIYNGADNVFDKPIIIAEGYDFMRVNDPEMIIKELSIAGIYKDLHNKGYDLVIVRWLNRNDYLENNTQVLKAVIRKTNQLSGNKKSILLGMSMGGVVSRMALKEMENKNEKHYVKTYISYDAPHNGAEVPLGYQSILNLISNSSTAYDLSKIGGGTSGIRNAKKLNTEINSMAAKQLLVYHFADKIPHSNIQNYLNTLGFPTTTKNIAITCGNTLGTPQYRATEFTPGNKIHQSKNGPNCFGRVTTGVWSSPLNKTSDVSYLKTEAACSSNTRTRSFAYGSVSYMNSPGGYIDLYGKLDGTFLGNISKFSFVPTASALGINKTDSNYNAYLTDLSIPVQTLIDGKKIPFSAVYSPNQNCQHLDLSSYSNLKTLTKCIQQEVYVPTITISQKGGNFNSSVNVTVSAKDIDGLPTSIYYTLDGTNPTKNSSKLLNEGTIKITQNSTLKVMAIAVYNDQYYNTYNRTSEIQTESYIINNAPILLITPKGGSFNTSQKVSLSATDDNDANPRIYYTTDGTEPSVYSNSILKNGELTISKTTTLKAFAYNNTAKRSATQTEVYTSSTKDITAPTITVTPKGGNYLSEQNVTVTVSDNVDKILYIYFTVDGSEPNGSSYRVINSLNLKISKDTTLKLLCVDTAGNSVVATEKYTFSTPQAGVAVWFKKPANWGAPKIHYWHDSTTAPSSAWPGLNMTPDATKGQDWYTFSIANVNYTHLLFHDGTTTNKTVDQPNVTGGCFDGNTSSWINCNQPVVNEFTVWFNSPWGGVPNIHYWNVFPAQPQTQWPGKKMVVDYPKGNLWYKFIIPGLSANIIFNDGKGNQTTNLSRNSSGCYDGYTKTWVACGSFAAKEGQTKIDSEITIDEIIIYPNPSSDYVSFNLSDMSNEILEIQILDLKNGQPLLKQLGSNTININSLSSGMYYYQVQTKTKSFKGKIIRE